MDLSKCGRIGEVVDRKSLSVKDAGEFLELLAESIISGKPLPLPLALSIAPALFEAATKAKADDQKGAINSLAFGTGLKKGSQRKKAPFWSTVGRILELIESGESQTQAAIIAAKEQGISKTAADDHWSEYQRQELEVCRLVESAARNQ